MDIHDISGLDVYNNYTLIRSADALVLVYSITDKGSFQTIRHWAAGGLIDGITTALVGTKLDMRHVRRVSVDEGKCCADEIGAEVFSEVSAKEGTGVNRVLPELAALLVSGKKVPS